VFLCPSFANGPQLLTPHHKSEVQEVVESEVDGEAMDQDTARTDGGLNTGQFGATNGVRSLKFKMPAVVEISLHSFGEENSTPYLLALLDDGDVFVYQGFYYVQHHHVGSKKKKKHAVQESLPLRFKRIENQILFGNLKATFDRGTQYFQILSINDITWFINYWSNIATYKNSFY